MAVVTPRRPLVWEVERLRPPTTAEMTFAKRAGLDPNALINRFEQQYQAATSADAATIREIADDAETCGPNFRALWDEVTQIADDRHEEWWIAPLAAVAQILAPGADTCQLVEAARRSRYVGHTVTISKAKQVRSRARCTRNESRPSAPRSRRASSSSTTSGSDPGDEGPGEQPPAGSLRLAPPPRAILTFGCLSAEQRGATVEVVR